MVGCKWASETGLVPQRADQHREHDPNAQQPDQHSERQVPRHDEGDAHQNAGDPVHGQESSTSRERQKARGASEETPRFTNQPKEEPGQAQSASEGRTVTSRSLTRDHIDQSGGM